MADEVTVSVDSNAFPLEEYEPAPEIYIDGMQMFTASNGVCKINCFSSYVDHEGKNKRRIVLRLAMPVPLLTGVQTFMGTVVEQLKRAGLLMETPNVRQ